MIRTGDQNNPFQGLNTASDGRDAPLGTFSDMENFRLNEQRNSLVSRGGYVEDVSYPTHLYKDGSGGLVSTDTGNESGLTWIKCHACFYHKVIEPKEKLIRVAICQYSYEMEDGGIVYLLRWLMYPYWDGSDFVSDWKDVTPYYIDWYSNAVQIDKQNNSKFDVWKYDEDTFTPEVLVYPYDLYNGYIYIEDDSLFTSPEKHLAEGDKIVDAEFYETTPLLVIYTENNHSGWGNTYDYAKIHKNLETGKIKYEHLLTDSATEFDDWVFSHFVEGGRLVVTVNPGKETNQYPAYRIQMSYINKTFMGNGNLWSMCDYQYLVSGVYQKYYDKNMVYGFPNYDNVLHAETEINGKTFKAWVGTPSVAETYLSTVKNNTYNKIDGSFFTNSGSPSSAASGSYDGYIFQISANLDMSIPVNGFVFQEYDVHGQYGTHKAFTRTYENWKSQTGDLTPAPGDSRYYNFEECVQTEVFSRYGLPIVGDEIGFDLSEQKNALIQILAVYNGYRIGLHNSDNSYDGTYATNPGIALIDSHYPIIGHPVLIPCKFNRNIESYMIVLSISDIDGTDAYTADVADGKVVLERSIIETDYDFYISLRCNRGGFARLDGKNTEYCYAKLERISNDRYEKASLGGNSLVITTNPDFNPLIPSNVTEEESALFGFRENYMRKDYSFGDNIHVIMRGRLFTADAIYHEYQQNEIVDDTYKEKRVVWYSDIGEFGSAYHLFDANTRRIWTTDIGVVTGLGIINFPQGVGQALMEDRNNLLILCEEGYKFVDLLENDPDTTPFREIIYHGDGCIAPDSVVSVNGYVFCAGREGIYMFNGYSRIDITKLSLCDITKDWKDLDLDIKKQVKGVYYKPRKWYMLFVPDNDQTYIYIFDMERIEIDQVGYIYKDRILHHMTDIMLPQYIDGDLYIPCEQIIFKYDENYYWDYGGHDIECWLKTNNINIDNFKRRISNVKIEYLSEEEILCQLYIDEYQVKSIAENSDTDKILNIRMNRSTKAGHGRGNRFSLYFYSTTGVGTASRVIVYDIDFSLIDVPQKRLIRRDI